MWSFVFLDPEEIGHSDANGIVTATGAAFFDVNATGKFLGNIVAVYKDIIYNNKDGTDKIVAWEWKWYVWSRYNWSWIFCIDICILWLLNNPRKFINE